jgi:hypothetical protein
MYSTVLDLAIIQTWIDGVQYSNLLKHLGTEGLLL